MLAQRTLLLSALLGFVSAAGLAETPDPPAYNPTLTFDVASIRPSAGITDHSLRVGVNNPPHNGKFSAANSTAKSLIQMAWGFGTPVAGGPDWLNDTYFVVQARTDAATDDQLAKLTDDQARLEKAHMLQVLLAERLHLKTHFETRDSEVYALTIAKGGPKLEVVKAPDPNDPNAPAQSANGADVRGTGTRQGVELTGRSCSTRAIAAALVSQLNQPVLDRTGLTGLYNFTLQAGREWSADNPESWPDIFTAVQQQLGLKLDHTRAATQTLVIDHIEQPEAN